MRIVALILLAAVLVSGCQAGRENDSLNAGNESTAPLQTEPSQPAQTDVTDPTQDETTESTDHTQPEKTDPVDVSLLTQEERDAVILKAFCELTGNDYDAIGSKLSVRHYWNSGVAYVFFVDGLEEYEDIITCTSANFRDFILPTTQPLYFYQEGMCYTLSNSRNMLPWPMEERDGFKISAVEVFLEFHKTQYPELYDPANWPAKSALNCPVYLSSEKRMEIENYFIQKSQDGADTWNHYNTDGLWYSEEHPDELRYYGNYEGYDFLFAYSMLQASQSETFGNIVFESNVQFSFYVYKDGETMPVTEAYEQGLISDEAIAQVAALHKQHGGKVETAE